MTITIKNDPIDIPNFLSFDLSEAMFFKENTRMLFGDAKESIGGLVSEFKE